MFQNKPYLLNMDVYILSKTNEYKIYKKDLINKYGRLDNLKFLPQIKTMYTDPMVFKRNLIKIETDEYYQFYYKDTKYVPYKIFCGWDTVEYDTKPNGSIYQTHIITYLNNIIKDYNPSTDAIGVWYAGEQLDTSVISGTYVIFKDSKNNILHNTYTPTDPPELGYSNRVGFGLYNGVLPYKTDVRFNSMGNDDYITHVHYRQKEEINQSLEINLIIFEVTNGLDR